MDRGIVVNLEGALNQVECGAIEGLGHALYSELTCEDGAPNASNFDNYRLIRTNEAPLDIETHFVQSQIHPTGLGEPGLPPVIGAYANALYKATGQRYYNQPFLMREEQVENLGA